MIPYTRKDFGSYYPFIENVRELNKVEELLEKNGREFCLSNLFSPGKLVFAFLPSVSPSSLLLASLLLHSVQSSFACCCLHTHTCSLFFPFDVSSCFSVPTLRCFVSSLLLSYVSLSPSFSLSLLSLPFSPFLSPTFQFLHTLFVLIPFSFFCVSC